MMALSNLAEWTGCAIISNLVDTAYSYLGERMLPADITEELTRLTIALPKIKAVMNVAEALKFKHPNSGVIEWLNNFKQAFFAAEDVIDELKYLELEDMVKNQEHVSESNSSSKFGSFKRKFSGFSIIDDTLGRLREVVKLLDLASTDVSLFYQFASSLHGLAEPHKFCSRETTSFLTESKVFGRENERAKVIEWLLKPASGAQISAYGIVGAGGLGKTTLAQLIFEDMSIENIFTETIWVCVSTNFNVEDITRKILQELGEETNVNNTLNVFQRKLKEKIKSKKVLFILDDVWNDDNMCDWEKLIAPLMFVQEGSKILLTTRMKSVADMLAHVLNVDQECLELRGLKEQDLLMLFNKYAFQGYNPDGHKDLQKIGNEIVKKLHGSPLAAKVIGSLLNSNMDFHYWKRILKFDSLINLEQAMNVADVLKLSYYHLSIDLQECFRFCAIFPHDYQFEKNRLIGMWVASGFIHQQLYREERLEDIGLEYFNHLVRKSFFEPHPRSDDYYIMHDLMHELAQNVSQGECCRVEENDNLVNIPSTTQHVYIHECDIEMIFHLRNLRTLVITMALGDIMCSDLHQFVLPTGSLKKTLRVLDVHVKFMCSCELPHEIGSLIHLRYLTIREGSQNLLPQTIYKLYHLQVLSWNGKVFETSGITNLVSLRYLKLPDEMMQNIKGANKLVSLQELTFFVGQERGHHIDELKTLKNLQKLSIYQLEYVTDLSEAKNAGLSEKENLVSLSLNWTGGSNYDKPKQIIDSLQPPLYLKELTINYYEGHESPIWLRNLPPFDLSVLKLSNCPSWEDLPLVAQMPHLRELSLQEMSEVKELDYSFDNTGNRCPFPSLERLHCVDMPKWQSWKGPSGQHGFPNLKEILIKSCPNLTELPAIPLSLSKFEVSGTGLNTLPDAYLSTGITIPVPSSLESSLTVVEITNCPNLKSLNGFLHQENLDLQAIEEITIRCCNNLIHLPISVFVKFESIKSLTIYGNTKLVAVDNQRTPLPVKLQTLNFGNCGEFDVQLLESASCLTSLRNLRIIKSASITCFPFSENAFASLRKLNIRDCDKLVQYSCMVYLQGASPGNSGPSLKIDEIYISHLSLLFIEPLRSLSFVNTCEVDDCSGMEDLPEQWLLQNSSTLECLYIRNASSLKALPGTMVRLTALKELYIDNANLLEEIPVLPTSLIYVSIEGAGGRQLASNHCQLTQPKSKGAEWMKLCKLHRIGHRAECKYINTMYMLQGNCKCDLFMQPLPSPEKIKEGYQNV